MRRSTPCIGICSTTYGDLVCRGCKRFAHEIVQWNGYSEAQREEIRVRLRELSLGALQRYVTLVDPLQLQRYLNLHGGLSLRVGADEPALLRAYEVLRTQPEVGPAELGIEFHLGFAGAVGGSEASAKQALLTAVEAEFAARAEAYYERSFKVPVR